MNDRKYNKKAMIALGVGAACILIFVAVQNINLVVRALGWINNLFLPLTLGFGLAMIIDLPMKFFEKRLFRKSSNKWLKKLRKPLALILAIAIILTICVGVVVLVIPQLTEGTRVVFEAATEMLKIIKEMDGRQLGNLPFFGDLLMRTDRDRLLTSFAETLESHTGSLFDTALDAVSWLIDVLVNAFLAFILAIYIIFEKDKLKKQCKRFVRAWMPQKSADWIYHAAVVSVDIMRNFIAGQTIEAVILGVLCFVGMFILDLPYAAAISALVGVTALIPVVGCFVGIIVGVFMIYVVSPVKSLIFLIFLLILHQVEENAIYPKVMGKKVNLPSLWVMAAVIIGGRLSGATGMLLGVPITSIVYTLTKEATIRQEEKKRLHETTEQVFE